MRLRFGALSVQAGLIRNPRYSWENTGSRAVCWRGQASGGNGLRAPARVATGRHRVTDSPRPRQQARPESSIRAPLNALTPSIPRPTPVSFCSPRQSHFELPPTLNTLADTALAGRSRVLAQRGTRQAHTEQATPTVCRYGFTRRTWFCPTRRRKPNGSSSHFEWNGWIESGEEREARWIWPCSRSVS